MKTISNFTKRNSHSIYSVFNLSFISAIFLLGSCNAQPTEEVEQEASIEVVQDTLTITKEDSIPANSYDFLFDTLLCDGFDYPMGSVDGKGKYTDLKSGKEFTGWYKAVKFCEEYTFGLHPAEDWNGVGGGDTDLGQNVYAIGKGVVKAAANFEGNWGNVVVVEHKYYENGKVKKIQSLYAHLDSIYVKEGDILSRRQLLGTIGNNDGMFLAHLHFEIRKESMFSEEVTFWPFEGVEWIKENYEHPTNFINAHRSIELPIQDSLIAVAIKNEYEVHLFKKGAYLKSFPIALGQNPIGHKEVQGDNRTPEGEYYINQKSLGPFSGNWAEFFGSAWIRLSYPNAYDAEAAFKKKLITAQQKSAIIKKINQKGMPPKNTAIGGGIGIHGWAGEWDTSEKNDLTWGCISINNDDLLEFYKNVPLNTRIIILP